MKVFTYDLDTTWPASLPKPGAQLRLDGAEERTADPVEADFFIVPWPLYDYEHHRVDPREYLPHLAGREHQHCWLELADCYTNHSSLVGDGVLFTCNMNRERRGWHKNGIAIPWPVEDLQSYSAVFSGGHDFDVCFQGWNSCSQRADSAASVQVVGLSHHVQLYDEFYGYYESTDRGQERRKSFLDTLQRSRVALCPRSIPGVFPYRFFEAMSAARVPALVCDDFVLPCHDRIPYDAFCIFIPDGDAHRAGSIIADWLAGRTPEQVVAAGQMARTYWSQWLDARRWPTTMRLQLEELAQQ